MKPPATAMRPTLICLHGWGGSGASFDELKRELQGTAIDILTPNLPGFGGEPDPPKAWSVDDYADWVEAWIQARDIAAPYHLLGHSHGGRIAIKLAVRHPERIAHLYLCAAAGIRHGRHLKRIIGLTLAKGGKALLSLPLLNTLEPLGKRLLYKLVRVHDYEKASPVLRETLIRVTREDFRSLLPQVKVPTDIFWGENDRMTPISDGIAMHAAIAGSALHRFPGVRHAVHRDCAREIAEIIRKRIASRDTAQKK